MMRALVALITVGSFFAVAFGAQSILSNATHPDHPGKCVDPTTNLVLGPEEFKSVPGSCYRISCTSDLSLIYSSCGIFAPGPNCEEVTQDFSKDYPECCEKYKCVNNEVV